MYLSHKEDFHLYGTGLGPLWLCSFISGTQPWRQGDSHQVTGLVGLSWSRLSDQGWMGSLASEEGVDPRARET